MNNAMQRAHDARERRAAIVARQRRYEEEDRAEEERRAQLQARMQTMDDMRENIKHYENIHKNDSGGRRSRRFKSRRGRKARARSRRR